MDLKERLKREKSIKKTLTQKFIENKKDLIKLQNAIKLLEYEITIQDKIISKIKEDINKKGE